MDEDSELENDIYELEDDELIAVECPHCSDLVYIDSEEILRAMTMLTTNRFAQIVTNRFFVSGRICSSAAHALKISMTKNEH